MADILVRSDQSPVASGNGPLVQRFKDQGDGTWAQQIVAVPPASPGGSSSALNLTAATLVKAGAGRLIRISVTVAGTAAGSANDAATTAGAAATNQLASIPNAVGVIYLDFPVTNGIVVTPGTGQSLSVSYL